MKDFYLTPRGDLAISNITTDNKKLEIDFITSYSNALCLNFFIEDTKVNNLNKDALSINFNIEKPEYDKDIKIVSGDEAVEQAIKIMVSSALGSIRGNTDIGSKIESVIHELIDNESTISRLKAYVQEAISSIIPNPTIYIEKPKTKYVDYSTTLKIIIIDNDKTYNISL